MSFPTTPSYIGQKWLDGGRVWQWNGTAWQAANNSIFWEEIAGKPTYMSGSTIVSTSAPANPIPGLQWWNPTADRLFVFDGAAWVEPNTNYTYPWDNDAVNYIYRVEDADGQTLELATQRAINNFVIGCKTDGIWTAIKASCILAGARTLSGALVPLVGTAPTNNNFESGDYNRKTGLLSNGSTKYLNANRNNNADPQNSKHLACYISQNSTVTGNLLSSNTGTGSSVLLEIPSSTQTRCIINGSNTLGINRSIATGFVGASRPNDTQMITRQSGSSITHTYSSATPLNSTIGVFSRADSTAGVSNGRYSFYSIGEHLDLAALDSRISTLMSDFNSVIP
jgi:hypothetical protein